MSIQKTLTKPIYFSTGISAKTWQKKENQHLLHSPILVSYYYFKNKLFKNIFLYENTTKLIHALINKKMSILVSLETQEVTMPIDEIGSQSSRRKFIIL